ncbi:phage tail spike protein [Clostridium perfringens]
MLQLYNKNKKKIAALTECENLCIESILESGDKTLSFYYSIFNKFYDEIEEETYIRTKTDEYVVKAKGGDSNDNKTLFTCKLNIEELEGTTFDRFESVEQNLVDSLNLAIVGTGWRLNSESCTNRKKRTIRMTNCSSWTIIQTAKKLYDIEFKFDTFNKVIMLFDRIGEDRGVYFTDSLNLRALQVQGNSYGFYTRIIPLGKDGLTIASVNGGKIYLENKQYSNKTLTYYWKDERYTKPESLKEDALEKLNVMSKPFKSYIASTINLAEMNEKYKDILEYNLGDYIYLVSKKNKVKDKHRIVKTKEYPDDHSKDTVELANKSLDLSEEKLLIEEMSTTLDNVTTDNGTLNGSTIDSIQVNQIEDFKANVIQVTDLTAINARIDNLHAIKADIQDLNAVKANIGTLEATKANITELNAVKADLQQAIIGKANITDLNAAVGKINVLESKTASIDNLLAGNLTADNFKANSIVAGSGIIAEGAIGSAQISSLSVNKLEAGEFITSKHKIVSADGTIEIVGNQILINRNNVNRVILGEYRRADGTTEYGLLVRAKDGQTIMLDGNGVHNAGITDGAIDNNKVADNANISGNKLDINSVIREVNTHGTETIKGTKVTVGDRTLDVELSTQNNTITEHSKELSSQKASLTALDNALKFKVDSQTFTQSTTTINNNINRAKEEAINTANNNTSNIINNLDIGVENLLSDSNKIVGESSNGEFIQFADIAPIIDKYGLVKYTISFDIKSKDISKCDVVNCYCQNGSATKYSIGYNPIKVTRDFKRVHVTITPTLSNSNETKAMLAFYGNYGTGNIPIIKNVKIELGQFATTYSLSKEDLKKYSDDVAQAKADLAQANAIANADGKITEEERKRIQQAQENLNTAIARADKAKQDAINAASLDATNKANNALNNAKAYTNSEITTVNTHLNKATTEINLLKGEINLKVNQTDIDKTIKTIEDKIKSTTEKITTVESNLTQKTNSIEAGVRDLNSTTQSITTNVSNINRDLSNKINSNLSEAKSFATDIATNKANTAKQEAINNAKAYTNAEITTINSKVHNVESNLNILSDRINSKVSQSDVEKSIKEVVFNGRNLVRDSDLRNDLSFFNINNNSGHGSIEIVNFQGRKCLKFTNISEYRVSKYLSFIAKGFKINNNVSIGVDVYAIDGEGLCFDTSHNLGVEYINIDFTEKNKWIRLNKTSSKTTTKDGDINFALYGKGKTPVNCYITLFKVEEGNKSTGWTPAPEDESKVILDNIKVVDSKISDVSSSVTQLRDSVTTDIRAINSKTHSIETILNEKASKQEITEVNNRVATIKASLDGITQRVSATESKTQTLESDLNGKASKQEVNNVSSKVVSLEANLNGITNRVSSTETVTKSLNDKLWETTNKLNNVEQRITPISIINTVSSAYYKKGEVDNVFSTKSEVEQLDNRINYKFSNTGYSNLIFNGNFANGTVHWRNWGNCSLVAENGQLTVRAKQSSNNANIGAVSSTFVLEKGKKYSLTFQCCSSWNIPWLNYIYLLGEDGVNHRLDLRIDINYADLVYRTAKFTAPATKWVRLLIGVEGYLQTDVSGFKLVDVCLVEGDIPRRFVPNANEISEGATSIDSNGVIVRHTNGSYTSMTLGGFEWKTKGMSKAYHCLAETGWVNISTGAWLGDHYDIKITLPEYFRGKVFTPCSMIQGWYVESNFSLNQLVVNIPYETINYSEGSFVIRVKALTRDGVFQRNINISWLAIA